jgi:hypothetical protein
LAVCPNLGKNPLKTHKKYIKYGSGQRIYWLRCYIINSTYNHFFTNRYPSFTQALQTTVSLAQATAVVGALKHICAWCADGVSFKSLFLKDLLGAKT